MDNSKFDKAENRIILRFIYFMTDLNQVNYRWVTVIVVIVVGSVSVLWIDFLQSLNIAITLTLIRFGFFVFIACF